MASASTLKRRDELVAACAAEDEQVARKHDRAHLLEIHEQHLMPRGMAGGGEDADASVAEDVVIALEELAVGVSQAVIERRIESQGAHIVRERSVVLLALDE